MTDQEKERVKTSLESYLHTKGIDTRKAFNCLNPVHADSNPSMSFYADTHRVHCFGCGVNWDIFGVIQAERNCSTAEAFNIAAAFAGLPNRPPASPSNAAPARAKDEAQDTAKAKAQIQALKAQAVKDSPAAVNYLQSRGISTATAERLNVGFTSDFKTKSGDTFASFQTLIFRTGESSLTARNINPCAETDRVRKIGKAGFYNAFSLLDTKTVCVVEGEFDVLSIEECGYPAVSLGGVSNIRKFVKLCEANRPSAPLCICLDNDDAGRKATAELRGLLAAAKIPFVVSNISGEYKDANERLVADRAGLEKALADVQTLEPEAVTTDVPKPQKTFETFSAIELMASKPPPIYFVVNDLLPQGLAILASPPKYGKSWLVMDLCLSVAVGDTFMNKQTNQSGAFYLALEDSRNRLYDRLGKVLDGQAVPPAFDFAINALTVSGGLLEQLENHMQRKPDTKLIVIDTLQKIRGQAAKTETAYGCDYREAGALKQFADKHGICVLLVHHLRKGSDDADVFNRISGTNGIMGAADTILVLSKSKRADKETTLSVTGRDIESDETLLEFDKLACKWCVVGNAEQEAERRAQEEYNNNPIRKTIKHLTRVSGYWRGTPTELHAAIQEHTGQYAAEAATPATLSKAVKKLQRLLFEIDDIIYTAPKNGGASGRQHTFKDRSYKTLCDTL